MDPVLKGNLRRHLLYLELNLVLESFGAPDPLSSL